ncbi:MAG: hypothetical protein AB7O59_23860 [Pirellulales bacterium]
MLRWTLGLIVSAGLLHSLVCDAQGAERRNPPRVKRGSYLEYRVIRKKDAPPEVRRVYSGYSANFPPPAFLYYGYPHSGDDTGIGPLTRN